MPGFDCNILFKSREWLLLITTLCLIACESEVAEQAKQPTVRPVKLINVVAAASMESGSYPAIVTAARSSELAFQVGGLLQDLSVLEAQEVKQGDVLARLDQKDFNSKADSAKAMFDIAEAEYQRAVRLAKEDAIARSVLEQRKSQRDVAKAELESAQKALNDTVLYAPFSGVVAKVPVEQLQNVKAGEPIVTLIAVAYENGSPKGAERGVEKGAERDVEKDAEKVELEATVNLPASVVAAKPRDEDISAFVILDAAPTTRIPAEFKEALLEADVISQTYEVTFSFSPPENLLILPGMSATVVLSAPSDAVGEAVSVSVPLDAIMSDGAKQYVWVVDGDTMRVAKRDVAVAKGIGENLVLTEGVKQGETIVGAGAAYLAEGMQVRAWTDS